MTTLTVTAKGQVTLRKDVMVHLGIQPGDRISVDKLPDGRIGVRAAQETGSISAVFNMFRREGAQPVSIDEMNEAIADGWAGRR